jgi:alkylation response protein AidB-like acyl-CoA dehydrogenase
VKQPTSREDEFREYAARWLAENRPEEPPFRLPLSPIEVTTSEQKDYLQAWQRRCYEAKLVGCSYPEEYGGHAMPGFQRIADQEMVRAKVPFLLNLVALNMVAPTLLEHGTEEQKKRFIPGCLSADDIWCQGFSEPGAGSDLASVRTSCERRGDGWIATGHKVWTSLGRFARYMILLGRTSRDDKYGGLTYFICPVEGAPGVLVRPLVKLTGEAGFSEVLLDGVPIPDTWRVGDVGAGWRVAMTTLLYERGAAENGGGAAARIAALVGRLIAHATRMQRDGMLAAHDPVTRDRLVELAIRARSIETGAQRARVAALCDHPFRLPLQGKVAITELEQAICELGTTLAGPFGQLAPLDPSAPEHGHWPFAYLDSYGFTIAAGTSEIQRNILGERVLGLEKSK